MLAELVSVPAPGTPLDGLFYEDRDGRDRGAAMLMHGNGMNFYYGPSGFLPEHLAGIGLATLAYNRHGHDTVSARTRTAEGNAYQTVAEAFDDNERAAGWLEARGHRSPVVIGHSNGGMPAAAHVAKHPGTPALVLLSAHLGGTEMLRRASALGVGATGRDQLVGPGRQLLEPVAGEQPSCGSRTSRRCTSRSSHGRRNPRSAWVN
jgi:pimeloyl-ACP methyl ester carboxylesterase